MKLLSDKILTYLKKIQISRFKNNKTWTSKNKKTKADRK